MSFQQMRTLIVKSLLLLTIVLVLGSCEQQPPKEGIEVSNAWIRDMPPRIKNTAAFMTINNYTGKPVTITKVTMTGAHHVMMHESKVVDGIATMSHLDSVTFDDSLAFEPGGKHIMIMGLDRSQGDKSFNISLHFANNPPLDVKAEVRKLNKVTED